MTRDELNLTEYERQVRRANGLSTVSPNSQIDHQTANAQEDDTDPHFGSMDGDAKIGGGSGPGTFSQSGILQKLSMGAG